MLSNGEIFEYFLSPIGVFAIAVLFGVFLTTMMTEQAGLMILYANRLNATPMTSLRALFTMLPKLPGIIGIAILRSVITLLCAAPFAAIGFWYFDRYMSSYDLNYLAQVRPPAFWAGITVGSLLVLAGAILVGSIHIRLILAIPAYFFGGRSIPQALRESIEITGGRV